MILKIILFVAFIVVPSLIVSNMIVEEVMN